MSYPIVKSVGRPLILKKAKRNGANIVEVLPGELSPGDEVLATPIDFERPIFHLCVVRRLGSVYQRKVPEFGVLRERMAPTHFHHTQPRVYAYVEAYPPKNVLGGFDAIGRCCEEGDRFVFFSSTPIIGSDVPLNDLPS